MRRTAFIAVLALALLVEPAAGARSIWTIAGTGSPCSTAPICGDGGAATGAPFGFPQATALDRSGNLYVVDFAANEIRKISPHGNVTIVAGDGTPCTSAPACGDGGPATSGQLNSPTGVAVDSHGNLYIADAGDQEIRKVGTDGNINRLAGTGSDCQQTKQGTGACGDGGPAVKAQLASPNGVAVDGSGNVYIADSADNEIRRVFAKNQAITTVAGAGIICATAPSCGDGGAATAGDLNFPEAVAVDSRGRLYIADNGDNEIRLVSGGRIVRLAGNGVACAAAPACGDGGSALNAQLNAPAGIDVDSSGNVYVADWGDNEVRVISRSGRISRLAGTGSPCVSPPGCGEAVSALSAQLNWPHGVSVDPFGNVYVSDNVSNQVRLITSTNAGPGRMRATGGSVYVLAFTSSTSRSSVAVRYVTSGSATASLSVSQGRGRGPVVATETAAAGLNQLTWNRRFGSRSAARGTYTLTVTISSGRASASSSVSVRL